MEKQVATLYRTAFPDLKIRITVGAAERRSIERPEPQAARSGQNGDYPRAPYRVIPTRFQIGYAYAIATRIPASMRGQVAGHLPTVRRGDGTVTAPRFAKKSAIRSDFSTVSGSALLRLV
jgi:hypothetical protein